VTTSHGPLFVKPATALLATWAVFAVLNVAVGVVLVEDPQRALDLGTMMRWGHAWLVDGLNVYGQPGSVTDYPPNAIVVLSPLSLLPLNVAVPIWAAVNVVLLLLAPYLAARFFRPFAPFRIIILPILMFLCWGGSRTLLQFTLLALAFAMATLFFADGKPLVSGAFLGLALIKPQVAVPVLLWAMFTRRWRTTTMAFGVAAVAYAVFCIRSQSGPLQVLAEWVRVLAMYHTDDTVLLGLSELRPMLLATGWRGSDVDHAVAVVGVALLIGICAAGFQEARLRTRIVYAAPPLAACWVLLALYHLTYGFVVLLPVLMMLTLSGAERSRLRSGVFWLLQLGLMFDIPTLARQAGLQGTALFDDVLIHADRILVITLFAGLAALAWQEPPLPDNLRSSYQDVG
jgi:hypothetical protein